MVQSYNGGVASNNLTDSKGLESDRRLRLEIALICGWNKDAKKSPGLASGSFTLSLLPI